MLNLNVSGDIPLVVSAKLIKSVEFKRQGAVQVIEPNVFIRVDVDTHIAVIHGRHVQLETADYVVTGHN